MNKKFILFFKKNRRPLMGLCFIIIAVGVMYLVAYLTLQSSIKKVEADRNESMNISKQVFDLGNQLTDKMGKLINNENPNYKDSDVLYNDIQNIVNKAIKSDQEFVDNAQKQKKDFKPLLSFMLGSNKNKQVTQIKKSLATEYDNCVLSQKNNLNDTYAVMPLIKSFADMAALNEAMGTDNVRDALQKAAPLQTYTRADFNFEHESEVKTTNTSSYDAMQNAKKLFADFYNYLLAVNKGDRQEANNLWNGLSNRFEVTTASMDNAMKTKNPLSETFYQTEITGIQQYIDGMDKLHANYNKNREIAYHTLQSIEYYGEREKKYPQVADFNALKQSLGLKYGNSDILKYSSLNDSSYTLEYLNNGNWIKYETKGL